ncbi:MAG: 2-C-methyl-D-erythritol 4-phosphate cytidylyltransferase [Flavobacteriales bacterium]|nr:2-C-methyl-D-erythritol 4-phosphate cytidylyltransferase [Flavobacteriales bacterium]
MSRATLIVAGGTGTRFGGSIPKQFQLLRGRPLLSWAVEAFHAFDAAMPLIVVLPDTHIDLWRTLCIGHGFHVPHQVVAGGSERFHSVKAGLEAVPGDPVVAVHDGVRPLPSAELIARCFRAAETAGSAIPVMPVTFSVREVDADGSHALDRARLRNVQTPQCFQASILKEAFALPYDPAFTDEATLVERTGRQVHLVEGEERNIKVTTPLDMRMAGLLTGG